MAYCLANYDVPSTLVEWSLLFPFKHHKSCDYPPGDHDALEKFYHALPRVIEDIFRREYGIQNFSIADEDEFAGYF